MPFTCTLLTRVLSLLPACRTVKANMSPKDETWEKSDTGAGIKATPYSTETKTSYSILRQDVCVFYKKRGTF